jgi:flagellar hook-associated protein 2
MRLSDMGIELQKDGSLKLDSTQFSAKLSSSAAQISEFFTGASSAGGWAKSTSALMDKLVGSSGVLSARTDGINASIKSLTSREQVISDRLVAIQTRYTRQFSALDSALSSMQQTSAYLTQQLANLSSLNG